MRSWNEVLAAGETRPRTSARGRGAVIEEEEGATNRLGGWLGKAVIGLAVFVSLFHLYAAAAGSPFYRLRRSSRPTICGRCTSAMVLALIYMLFPMCRACATA